MNRLVKTAMCVLFAAALIPAAACSNNPEADPNAQVLESESPTFSPARKNAPMLGTWTATSTDPNTGLDAATTLFTFHEDGTVTSVDPNTGANELAIFVSVTWDYNVETGDLMMRYEDIRGQVTEYTFDVTVARDNYIIIRVVSPESEAGLKLSLTR